jgi:hypothetical protein
MKMFEVIKDFCAFHQCCINVSFNYAGLWQVRLYNESKDSGCWNAEDLQTAFTQARECFLKE